ncbi:hypothetical protein ACOSP7_000297 [Xanthoceras sorbifolium]
MGKKISPASLMKISKIHRHHHHHHEKKKHLNADNSLIKVVRPKVYITDSSSFKSLVQQLTGLNGGNTTAIDISSSSSSSPPQTQLDHHDRISIVDIDQDDHHGHHHHLRDHDHPDESNSMEATSSDYAYASVDSLKHIISCNLPVSFTEELNQLAYDQTYQLLDHETVSEFLLMNQQQQQQQQQQKQQEKDFWDNQDMDSWLLNIEACPNISYNGCYSQNIQQEVSIYDYELSGLI